MNGLNSQKFFSGTWFVTHAKKGFSTILCREITFKKNDSTVESNTKGKVRERKTKTEYTVHCTGKENKGKVPFKCTREEGERSIKQNNEYDEEFTVAETDYNSFAVVCINKANKGKEENILVINKKKDADIPSAATSTLQNLGLNSDSLGTRKSSAC
uniref:Putative triabin-like lipocalin n=1 Tax=Rhodnius prolixus TaxID=13249 RepID=R4FJ72_RHOPR